MFCKVNKNINLFSQKKHSSHSHLFFLKYFIVKKVSEANLLKKRTESEVEVQHGFHCWLFKPNENLAISHSIIFYILYRIDHQF